MFMESDALYDKDAGKMFRSFNLISQHCEDGKCRRASSF